MVIDGHTWNRARLIPTSGIKGDTDKELRATSALLAVIRAVPEFGHPLLTRFGAPWGRIDCFVEVPFTHSDGAEVRPDGLITVSRGSNRWTALVEVKTGNARLKREQLEKYLDVCRAEKFDAVISISNQFSPVPGEHPVTVSGRKTLSVKLHHLSWNAILTEAVIQHEHRGVSDPDQAWILSELIAYLEHPNSGAMGFEDMGPTWTTARDVFRSGSPNQGDPEILELVSSWEELSRFVRLTLGRNLGADVSQVLPRRERANPEVRRASAARLLVESGTLTTTFRVPDAVGDIDVVADLKTRVVSASVELPAPKTGRPRTRVNWLVRQMQNAPENTRVEVSFEGVRRTASNPISDLREDSAVGLDIDPRRNPRSFAVRLSADMGAKRRTGSGSFIQSVMTVVDRFYREVVQDLEVWRPPAPRLPTSEEPAKSAKDTLA